MDFGTGMSNKVVAENDKCQKSTNYGGKKSLCEFMRNTIPKYADMGNSNFLPGSFADAFPRHTLCLEVQLAIEFLIHQLATRRPTSTNKKSHKHHWC